MNWRTDGRNLVDHRIDERPSSGVPAQIGKSANQWMSKIYITIIDQAVSQSTNNETDQGK